MVRDVVSACKISKDCMALEKIPFLPGSFIYLNNCRDYHGWIDSNEFRCEMLSLANSSLDKSVLDLVELAESYDRSRRLT